MPREFYSATRNRDKEPQREFLKGTESLDDNLTGICSSALASLILADRLGIDAQLIDRQSEGSVLWRLRTAFVASFLSWAEDTWRLEGEAVAEWVRGWYVEQGLEVPAGLR
ncbi:hypothetical protein AB0I28_31995 [Phytomonospora sp. NPDC050363]|uniref:hypothetical protein n=1 Tax=Phytomonospora sp. NPDC050363 TaxID=3155642 RepID=UPI003411501C